MLIPVTGGGSVHVRSSVSFVVIVGVLLLQVQLWDTAGQERFRQSMVRHYYRNVHAVVFVYDMTKWRSFESVSGWIGECRTQVANATDIPTLLVGNKCDMDSELAVGTGQAQKFADQHDMPLFETSAKADSESDHVDAIFMTLVHKLKDCKTTHVQSERERLWHKPHADADADADARIVRLRDQTVQDPSDARSQSNCPACY